MLVAFGSFQVAADRVMRLPRPLAAALLVAAFALAGVLYGLVFRRAANDRLGGWLFGTVFGFLLWMAAPILVLPLLSGHSMAAGRAAAGFLAGFLVWGVATGGLFPHLHKPLQAKMDGRGAASRRLGPSGAALSGALLRRVPKRWR